MFKAFGVGSVNPVSYMDVCVHFTPLKQIDVLLSLPFVDKICVRI